MWKLLIFLIICWRRRLRLVRYGTCKSPQKKQSFLIVTDCGDLQIEWHTTFTEYGKNEEAISILGDISYSTGELHTQTTTEPGGDRQSITFTDKRGRTVLTRRQNSGGTLINDTYTTYDDKDRPNYILPPGVISLLTN